MKTKQNIPTASLIVCKFGGSSVASPEKLHYVVDIFEADPARRALILSAPGKNNPNDKLEMKATDKVLSVRYANITDSHELQREIIRIFKDIFTPFIGYIYQQIESNCDEKGNDEFGREASYIARQISLLFDEKLALALENICAPQFFETQKFSDRQLKQLACLPEILLCNIVALWRDYHYLDPFDVFVYTGSEYANKKRDKGLDIQMAKNYKTIIPGFYCSNTENEIHLFERNGSDLTGSLVAQYLEADLYENWSDVDGILSADPRIVKSTIPLAQLSYRELGGLCKNGAQIFQYEAIKPVETSGIPLVVKNVFKPSLPGTLVLPPSQIIAESESDTSAKGISGKTNLQACEFYSSGFDKFHGVMNEFSEIFQRHSINVLAWPDAQDAVSAIYEIDSEIIDDEKLTAFTADLEAFETKHRAHKTVSDCAMLYIISDNMNKPGTLSKITKAIAGAEINTMFISQSLSAQSILIGVETKDFVLATQIIHTKAILR